MFQIAGPSSQPEPKKEEGLEMEPDGDGLGDLGMGDDLINELGEDFNINEFTDVLDELDDMPGSTATATSTSTTSTTTSGGSENATTTTTTAGAGAPQQQPPPYSAAGTSGTTSISPRGPPPPYPGGVPAAAQPPQQPKVQYLFQ